jgi:acid phosphatase type 7
VGPEAARRARGEALEGDPFPVPPPRDIAPGETFVVAAAGDIAGRTHRQRLTAALLAALHQRKGLAAILPLGDLQYPGGDLHDFLADYDRSWGHPALKPLTRPVPGNHEYGQGRSYADGYFDYFNGRAQKHGPAGERDRGYYSFGMGDWHFVALNTSDGCRKVSCAPGSPMVQWLVRDLAATTKTCVLAYWHHPRFQQGEVHGDSARVAPLWDALFDAGADVVLAAHDHNFQQLAPLDKEGRVDRQRGIRSFVVGTGGARPYYGFDESVHKEAVEARVAGRHGVLELTLGPGRYSWRFLAAGTGEEAEALAVGSDVCR